MPDWMHGLDHELPSIVRTNYISLSAWSLKLRLSNTNISPVTKKDFMSYTPPISSSSTVDLVLAIFSDRMRLLGDCLSPLLI